MTKKNPCFPQTVTHPGEELKEMLEELKMGPKEFAVRTHKPEKTISAILKGSSSITPEMAVIFENVLKVPADYWLSRQRRYDEALARATVKIQLKESLSWANQFPVTELQKRGWLPPLNSKEEATQALLHFFGLSNKMAWEAYYFERRLKASFGISLYGTKSPYALSAWLRQGEITARLQTVASFYASQLKKNLPQFKKLMMEHPEDFFEQLKCLSAENGIYLVYTPCLTGISICGATKWLNDNPVIQLSGGHDRYDSLWFTFFHELGHIFLHGKKGIFLEEPDYPDSDKIKESEADAFAEEWLFTKEQQNKVIESKDFSFESIRNFAAEFGTHPSIIAGRLQHLNIIDYKTLPMFRIPIKECLK